MTVDADFRASPLSMREATRTVQIQKDALQDGISQFEDIIAYKGDGPPTFFDRHCDHNGGRLMSIAGNTRIVCPLHGWEFDPARAGYVNVNCSKEPLASVEHEGGYYVELVDRLLEMPSSEQCLPVRVRFLNHACIVVACGDLLTFATDPWILGPAFCNGWWLSRPSPEDAIEALNACDFIYISHNHPDHLHEETLGRLRRDMLFVVPEFATSSVEVYLRSLGFTNLFLCKFGFAYQLGDADFRLSIFKSGDFRDDSGLWFQYGVFSSVLTVDCNALNAYNLPKDVTLLATSFAGGATGFPLCFWNYSHEDRLRIVTRNRNAMRHSVSKYLEAVRPKYYLPYAGYFTVDADRDEYIYKYNKKNEAASYADTAARFDANLVDVDDADILQFEGKDLVSIGRSKLAPAKRDRDDYYADAKSQYGDISYGEIETYFSGADFISELLLYIDLTDTSFDSSSLSLEVDFRQPRPRCRLLERVPHLEELKLGMPPNRLVVHARKEVFGRVVRDLLPWEDMMIGFQARIERWPNSFNSDFWYYFTNVYIKSRARRAIEDCGQACERISQRLY